MDEMEPQQQRSTVESDCGSANKETMAIQLESTTSEDANVKQFHATVEEDPEPAVNNDDGAGTATPEGKLQGELTKEKKKKKGKFKSKMSKGLDKPTGFEEFFAEAPLTPAEAQQNTELYGTDKPVDQRIQTAVQRFCARRKFDSATKQIFDRYLDFGGIDSGPKMFGGGDDADAGELTASEITALKHPKYLNDAVLNGEMVIDFDGVMRAYLSSYSAMWFTTEPEAEIKRRVNVLRSFLNYLLHHGVCPEYNGQVQSAKKTCDVAEAQLWFIEECARNMPGEFNMACSVLFHGWYHDAYIRQLGDEEPDKRDARIVGAQSRFTAALASHGSATMCGIYQTHNNERRSQPLRKFSTGLEVIRSEFPSKEVRDLYKMPMFKDCKPTGRLFAREWRNPARMEEDLTDDEDTDHSEIRVEPRPVKEYEFWIEEELLAKVFPGLKFEAEVYELTFGMHFFETPTNFRCSFFSWLPNEAMMGYKEHEYLLPREPLEANVEANAEVNVEANVEAS